MATGNNSRFGDLSAMVRISTSAIPAQAPVSVKRVLIAQLCRLIGHQLGQENMRRSVPNNLSPRLKETLELLLAGYSEKEVATKMKISVHTVHVHVKRLHKHFDVASRAELLARCLSK
jgi:DNA-binding NarL/FixJ family response regulator